MGYHPRIEDPNTACLITTRSRNSELWFVNNNQLETASLGYLAKFKDRYQVKVFAFGLEGNHNHQTAQFPNSNRSAFMRDFNSCLARAVDRLTPEYQGGRFWGRRYSSEILPDPQDIEKYFFYVVLQPVQDGLVEKISDYQGYNCFNDAAHGFTRKFKVVNWTTYNEEKRRNKNAKIGDHIETFELKYDRIPGYEHLSQKEYANMLIRKLRDKTHELVEERRILKLGFAGPEKLKQTKRGALPKHTKTSDRNTHRARVLCLCPIRRQEYLVFYFDTYFKYKECSKKYRAGELHIEFPPGTYRPYFHGDVNSPTTVQ